uniref:Integrase catalytic domain-containing protein n=1 Tax=Fagus sylvatica TaxID=28930 RepID=A0A2N9G4I2_FAGSY
MSDVVNLLKQEREKNPKEPRLFVRKPPYPTELLKQPYPEKYIVPTFSRFDGRKGSALVHISKFIDSMGAYIGNGDLCLREFSKSLDDRAYTWYTTLPPESVKVWEDMVELFCGKYFQAEEKITLVNLHTTKQASGEDLLHYIHRFRDISLDCYANYEEGELVGVCIDNMLPEFRAHLENLDISRFAQLLQKARKTALSVKPHTDKPKKKKSQPQVLTVSTVNNKRKKSSERSFEETPPPAPKKATEEDKKNPKFCYFHQYVHHSTADCWTLRRKFYEKIQDGTLELPQAKQKVHIDPFLKHKDRAVVSVVIHGNTSDVDMDEPAAASTAMTPTAIKKLQRNLRFRSLFNLLGLNPEARTAATKAIMAIAADSRAHCFTYPDHRRPLYLSATINEVQVRRALVDTSSYINLIPLSTIQTAEISRKKIQGEPMEIKGFGGVGEYTKGHIQLVLKVGPIVALTRFHVVDSVVPYHILLGRPWLHKHQLIPSTYHQCVKGRLNGKPIRIAANSTPFDQSESHFVEATLYDEPSCLTVNEADVPESADTAEAAVADPKISVKEELETQKLVAYSLNVESGTRLVVQPMRTFHPEVEAQVTQEVKKLLSANFIKPIQHPQWLSNIVPVKKKNGQIRCCVDFRNLNKACPKDEFSLPNMDLLIDSAAGHAMFSFMDGFSGYNQIFMSSKDAEKTLFRTPIGNFYYTVMPFGLKNARATYQRTMTAMFHDMMHREIEDYVNDDIVVKSKTREDHFGILKKVFERCRLYKLKMNPIKCAFGVSASKFLGLSLLQRPVLSGRLAQWLLQLSQYEIITETPTAIKSQAIADLLAQFPREDNSSISDEVPGEINEVFLAGLADSVWSLKFDGSSTATSAGAGIVLYKDDGEAVTKSFKFDFPCSNNAAEYEAYLVGLAIAYEMRIKHLRVIGDSNLVNMPKGMRIGYADALATLGSQITFEGEEMDVAICKKMEPITELLKKEFEELSPDQEDWRVPIKAKLMSPAVVADLREIKDYTLISGDLYRRLSGGVLARCISIEKAKEKLLEVHEKTCEDGGVGELSFGKAFMESHLDVLALLESQMVIKETHAGECGEDQGKKRLYQCLLTLDYYWPTMKKDAADFVKTCHTCQVQANLIHTHPTSLQNMATPWPFHTWGLDLIGPINPASGGYIWILVATEYFTKWAEAIPLRKATGAAVANFIRKHIITRFGIPYKLISDNGTPFINKDMREVLEHYQVKHRRSTPYYPQGNGQAEATNRMLLRILSKMVFDYGNDWRAHLADVLWAYRSSPKIATGFTPFSLVYGIDTYFSY